MIQRILNSTSFLLLFVVIACAQGSDQKEDILSARQALKDASRNRELCDKLGFPASLTDNRCYSTYPDEISIWGKGFSDGLAKVTVNGKIGFIDTSGKLVIAATLRDAGPFSEGLAPYESGNGKWGYVDKTGKVVIAPKFDWAISFREGLALVQVGKNWGYIAHDGSFVIEPRFEEAESFSEGVAVVGWYDPDIEWMAAVPRKGRWVRRFIDKGGAWAIDESFDIIHRNFDGGMAIVSKGLGYSQKHRGKISESVVIDSRGRELWKLDSASINWFSEDAIVVETERPANGFSRYNFRDRSGKLLCNVSYENPSGFSEGLSRVRVKDRYGFIDKNCEVVIEPKFSDANGFSEGLAWVKDMSGNSGFIDRSGKFVLETGNTWVGSFSNGFALVLDGAKAGYMDRNGKIIWPPTN